MVTRAVAPGFAPSLTITIDRTISRSFPGIRQAAEQAELFLVPAPRPSKALLEIADILRRHAIAGANRCGCSRVVGAAGKLSNSIKQGVLKIAGEGGFQNKGVLRRRLAF